MLPRLGELNGFKYYFQFTLNPYGKDIERNLPSIEERIETFRKLSETIGKERVVWRYDPILINETYDARFHREAFARLARKLSNHTERCMLGFIDRYRHIRPALDRQDIRPPEHGRDRIDGRLVPMRGRGQPDPVGNMRSQDRSEPCGHSRRPVYRQRPDRADRRLPHHRHQRPEPAKSLPLYRKHRHRHVRQSCPNGCTYCYATRGKENAVANNFLRHNPELAHDDRRAVRGLRNQGSAGAQSPKRRALVVLTAFVAQTDSPPIRESTSP